MATDLRKIRAAQVAAAEDAVIASIPATLLENLKRANEELAARGGCPGCGSTLVGVHTLPCSWCSEHPFD